MARKKSGRFNKSAAIKDMAKATGKKGQELAEALKKEFPAPFLDDTVAALSSYCSSVLSQARKSAKKARRAAKAEAADTAAPMAIEGKPHSPFMTQLKTLTSMLGRQAVKDMVDKL